MNRARAKDDATLLRWDLVQLVRLHLRPTDIVLHVGASSGMLTRFFAATAAHVYAFEPNPELAAELRAQQLDRVTVNEAAASDTDGEASFFIDSRPGHEPASGSLNEVSEPSDADHHREVTVCTVTIDGYCRQAGIVPTFVRIDVGSHAPAVLAGARATIAACRPTIVFETGDDWRRFEDVLRWLGDTHYLVRASDGADAMHLYGVGKARGNSDILCLPLHERSTGSVH